MKLDDLFFHGLRICTDIARNGYDQNFMERIYDFCQNVSLFRNPVVIIFDIQVCLGKHSKSKTKKQPMIAEAIAEMKKGFLKGGHCQYLWVMEKNKRHPAFVDFRVAFMSEDIYGINYPKFDDKRYFLINSFRHIRGVDCRAERLFTYDLSKFALELPEHSQYSCGRFRNSDVIYPPRMKEPEKTDDLLSLNRFFNNFKECYKLSVSKHGNNYLLSIRNTSGKRGPVFFIGNKIELNKLYSRLQEMTKDLKEIVGK